MSNLARWRSLIPDTPETLETRAIAIARDSVAHPFGHEGVMLLDRDHTLACLYGEVDVESFAMEYRDLELACEVVAPAAMAPAIWSTTGLRSELAHLKRLGPQGLRQPATREGVRTGQFTSHELDQIDDEDLRSELAFALRSCEVWSAYVNGRPASLAYAPWQTERYADISVDTVEAMRGQGLGAIAVAALVERLLAAGKEPIWGAVVSNAPSHSLAKKLGFTVPAGELLVLTPTAL